jgi:hypothetical protein
MLSLAQSPVFGCFLAFFLLVCYDLLKMYVKQKNDKE